jgi:hypothetical protein
MTPLAKVRARQEGVVLLLVEVGQVLLLDVDVALRPQDRVDPAPPSAIVTLVEVDEREVGHARRDGPVDLDEVGGLRNGIELLGGRAGRHGGPATEGGVRVGVPSLPEVGLDVVNRGALDHRVRVVPATVGDVAAACGALVERLVVGRVPAAAGEIDATHERQPAVRVLDDDGLLVV